MSDQDIEKACESKFKQYDKDQSGYLDLDELGNVVNAVFK